MTERQTPVAVVGMAVLLPGAPGLDAYWANLRDAEDSITEVPAHRWDADYYRPGSAAGPAVAGQVYCRRGGFVDGLAEVEVTRHGIMPASVPGTEPDQLIALDVAAAALADAGGPDRLPERHRVGVVLGRGGYLTPGLARLDQRVRTAHQLTRTLGELLPDLTATQLDRVRAAFADRLGPDSPDAAIGLVPNLAASRIANRLDLRGPAYTVDAACASSLVAVDQAVTALASGRCDLMLAGGVHHCHDITLWSVFSQLRALSPTERIRPFHRDADGILIGEGTGVVVLKRLADAERDGDRVYAVIRGTGVAGDGRTAGLVTPDPGGQGRAVREAWRAAGLDPAAPDSIGLLEAHGTATPAGDTAELTTLAEVFGPGTGHAPDERPVLGSVKSMIGHTMPAAGVAGLVKAALALHHRTLLPTLHCDDPHPGLAATRFRTLERARPWETGTGRPVRRAAVNAFGFGGINAHVVLEEAPATRPAPAVPVAARRAASVRAPAAPLAVPPAASVRVTDAERVLLLSAADVTGLAALLDADDSAVLAAGLDPGRAHADAGPARLGVVDPTAKRLALTRRAVAKGRAWQGRGDVWFRPTPLLGRAGGKLAFVFPGLEADFTARTDDIAAHFGLPPVDGAGPDVRVGDIGRHGFGVVGVGRLLDRALRRMGLVPDAVAGHSVGEWTAMAAAGLYSAAEVDAFMTGFDPDSVTVPGLVFAAVGTSAAHVRAALADAWAGSGIVLSHDNAPRQAMVCGPGTAVEEFVRSLRAEGVLCQVLPFRSGFHTPMLEPFLAPIKEAADRFRIHPPAVPVWSGTTAAPFPRDEPAVRALFVRHLLEPVRFRELTEAMYAAGHRVFVQTGPGRLTSLIDDTLGDRDHLAVAAGSPHHGGLAQLRRTATALWTAGATVTPLARAGASAPLTRTAASAPSTAATTSSATGATLTSSPASPTLTPPTPSTATEAAPTPSTATEAAPTPSTATEAAPTPSAATSTAPTPSRAPVAHPLRTPVVHPPGDTAAHPPRTAAAHPAGARPRVRLDLGSALVSLDGPSREALRAQLWGSGPGGRPGEPTGQTGTTLPAAAEATPADREFSPGPGPSLDDLARRHPAAAELTALLRDTAHTAAELITASHGPRAAGTHPSTTTPSPAPGTIPTATGPTAPAPAPPAATATVPPTATATATTALGPTPTALAPTPTTPAAAAHPATASGLPPAPSLAPTPVTTTLRVSAQAMPHLLDHCFFPQRDGWPELADRWPVVPATTIVRHMMDAAEHAKPGRRAVAVHGARFDRWLTATPPVDVPVTVTPAPGRPDRVTVTFGSTARAVVELAPHHPAPPPRRPLTDLVERVPVHTAAQLYRDRWMFHGPRFQGLTELTAIGERHIRGVITTPAAPGALLDNVGQLLGYWIMATRTARTVVFPVRLEEARFHGPHPEPGTEVHCVLRITTLTDTLLEADAELTVGDRVWARLTGWQDRRFDNDPTTRPVERFPERHTLATAMPGGWALVHERWPDLASRELIMRNSLASAERAAYARRPPRGRRQWLLGRIAVKDAVRHWLWQHGEGPVFPAEIQVGNDELGRPHVTGLHGRVLPPLDVSLAHRAEAGVAIVRPHRPRPGPGIDIEEITDRDPATLTTALGPAELRLLRSRCADGGEPEAVWFTRFWAAKEAVAKAEGVGFGGRPRDFAVLEAAPDGTRLLVSGRLEGACTVHCAPVTNPPALPERGYVVAWTTGPAADDGQHDAAAEEYAR
ncbi:type I polyketide synthase [Streptomyces echinatus]|uniref:Acyl transferase domain-containing protein/phosphopantetheinyl transferase n=2 Tax=Streptomyces echinatus TaxID=67293 RepID=A0A7W9UPC3_9ACTN|nr:type I polyketide synthase [Streptomyces echinatus]MBB5926205.1 acyl transferase domain-containing protein/phosphopantetheinyl transferase [Streptomyces echinatus]